jgi:hypothetical protein
MFKNTLKLLAICSLFAFCISCSNKSTQVDLKLIPVKSGGKYGYINKKGEYVINLQFAYAGFFRNGLARVESSDGKIGFIDNKGNYKIPAKFKDATHFFEDLAFVVSDGRHPICIDKSGEMKFQLKQAKGVCAFSEGLAMFVSTDGKFGFVDKTGKVVINPLFEFAYPFFEGLAAVKKKDKWGFIDKTGKIVINPQFDNVVFFTEGKAAFYDGKEWGFIDKKGNYVINSQYKAVGSFSEGMALVLSGKEWGYITKDGKIEINPQFEAAYNFSGGLALIKQNDKWGFIDKKGKMEISPQFDDASPFFGDIAFVKKADKWGIIDKAGKYLANPQFDLIASSMAQPFDSYVWSDFYDASAFINKFFKKMGDNSFDGFTASSTLQNVVDNTIYGDYANCPGNGRVSSNYNGTDVENYVKNSEVICKNKQNLTDDIFIKDVTFHFENRICTAVSNGYWGTSKRYKFDENISIISYKFDLSGDADGKEDAIANEIKTYIESKFNIKFSQKDNEWGVYYDFATNGKMSFAIITTKQVSDYYYDIKNHLEFFVAFDKDAIDKRLYDYYSGD